MLRKTSAFFPPFHARWSPRLTYSTTKSICARFASVEASSSSVSHSSGFFDSNNHQNTLQTSFYQSTLSPSNPPANPQAIARQAAQAIRTSVLKNNDQRGAYAILNSLHQLSKQYPESNPLPTRLATSALIHSLIRVGSPFRAAQVAEIAWIGTNASPTDYANSMKLHWRTTDSVVQALTAHHASPSYFASPDPSPPDSAHSQYVKDRAGTGEGARDLSKTKLDHATQRAVLFLRVARNARQERQQAMYSRIIQACLLQGEIIVATLLFVLLVRDYQVRKLVKAAKEELKERRFTAEASVEESPTLAQPAAPKRPVPAQRSIGWLSTVPPDILVKLDSLKYVDVDKAIELGLDQLDEDGEVCPDAPKPSGDYLRRIISALDIKFGSGPLRTGPPSDGNQSALAFSELARLANERALEDYGNLPEKLAHYAASPTPMSSQPLVSSHSNLLDSYALREIPLPQPRPSAPKPDSLVSSSTGPKEEVLLGTLCHKAILTLSHHYSSSPSTSLTRSAQKALVQYAYHCDNTRLATKLVKTIREREGDISINMYSAIISGLVQTRKLEAAGHVIEIVHSLNVAKVTPMARVLMDALMGDENRLEEDTKEQSALPVKSRKRKKGSNTPVLQPISAPFQPSTDLLRNGPPLNKQDNLSIALIYYATSGISQPSLIAQLLPTILPHAFDDSLLFPPTSSPDDSASLNLAASYGPRLYIELMNALRKGGHTGLVERVWNVAVQASKHSWRVYVKRKMRETLKPVTSGAFNRVSLDHSASPRPLPGLDQPERQIARRESNSGLETKERRVWDDMPWMLDIGAWTMLMKVYGMERKKGFLAPTSESSGPDNCLDGQVAPNHHARGWGGVPTTFSTTLPRDQLRSIHSPSPQSTLSPRRTDLALERASAIHSSLAFLHRDMVHFLTDIWTERETKHKLYDPSKSSRGTPYSKREEQAKRDELDLLRTRIFHKLERSMPVPDERYFNAALQVFGRERRRQNDGSLWNNDQDVISDCLRSLAEDMEAFGFKLPPIYKQTWDSCEMGKRGKVSRIIPVVCKRARRQRIRGRHQA